MEEYAIYYYREGYNCSQCILQAASKKYNIYFQDESLKACYGINNGFGIGGFCSAIVGAIMVLGLIFEEDDTKVLRLQLLMGFRKKFHTLNCCEICECIENCEPVVREVARLTEELIEKKRKCKC